MSKDRENIPRANMLMGSMRSMSYSFESAVADIIDNSISANVLNCEMRSVYPEEEKPFWQWDKTVKAVKLQNKRGSTIRHRKLTHPLQSYQQ